MGKSLDSFDFLAIPVLDKILVPELAGCEYLARKENVLLFGINGKVIDMAGAP